MKLDLVYELSVEKHGAKKVKEKKSQGRGTARKNRATSNPNKYDVTFTRPTDGGCPIFLSPYFCQRSCGRVNVMGGLRYHDRKRICYFIEKGNGESFYEQLEKLNEYVKNEWIEQGNQAGYFSEQGPKILIILDHASYHKKKDILQLS